MNGLFAMLAIAVLGIGVPVLLIAQQHRLDLATMLAAQLGLQNEGTALTGTYKGISVYIETLTRGGKQNSPQWARCTATIDPPLIELHVRPESIVDTFLNLFSQKDIQVGEPALDSAYLIVGPDEQKIRQILSHPTVSRILLVAVADGREVEITSKTVRIHAKGTHLEQTERRLDEAVALVRAMAFAQSGPWAEFAAKHRLRIDKKTGVVTGKICGIPLKIDEYRPTYFGATYTRIEAHLERPLPKGTHIVHTDLGSGPSEILGDPILDSMVHVATSDIETLRARVVSDDARGALLEIVHGHPTSHVESRTVVALHEGMLLELDGPVEAVVELACSLA